MQSSARAWGGRGGVVLRGQPSRHNVILFKDGDGAVTSMALDEFPHVELREPPDPDV